MPRGYAARPAGVTRHPGAYGQCLGDGRGKPSSESVSAAAARVSLGLINAAVDCRTAVSPRRGVPIIVVDFGRKVRSLRVDVPCLGNSDEINRGGQTIDASGLWCSLDAAGPCANAMEDAQRPKTREQASRLLVIV